MSRRRRRTSARLNWLGPIVVAVVMGGVAWSVNQRVMQGDGGALTEATPSSTETDNTPTSTQFLVGIRAPRDDRDRLFTVDAGTGEALERETRQGWRVEALHEVSGLSLDPDGDRGTILTDGGDWRVFLRAANGEAYDEPRILGMFDERHAALVARAGSYKILDASSVGQVRELTDLAENESVLGYSGGAVWVSSFTPGEGLESAPTGPSTLFRISSNGSRERVAEEAERVIVGVLSDGERMAYWHDDGFVATEGANTFSGDGLPLLWQEGGGLLVSKGVTLLLYKEGSMTTLSTTLPASPVAAAPAE